MQNLIAYLAPLNLTEGELQQISTSFERPEFRKGGHVGQLFTIVWTVLIASAGIYLLAQVELAATVIPAFPVWPLAGLIGSALWLIWLFLIGVKFLKIDINKTAFSD